MQALIEHLVKLQGIETDRGRLTREMRALPAEVAKAEGELASAERHSAETSSALSREETMRTRLEREIDEQRKKAARFRAQLDAVKTPEQASAIEHEMQFAATETERLESEEYASLERTEAHENALAAARAKVETLAEALEGIRLSASARQKELAGELATLDAARETERAAIEPEWLARFDRMVTARGTGIARAENQQCTSCSMGIRPQTWNQLREGQLLTCDSCSRLLYWDSTIQAAPKAPPQPELIPGAGQAVRKQKRAEA
jgi:uncharacterized protein